MYCHSKYLSSNHHHVIYLKLFYKHFLQKIPIVSFENGKACDNEKVLDFKIKLVLCFCFKKKVLIHSTKTIIKISYLFVGTEIIPQFMTDIINNSTMSNWMAEKLQESGTPVYLNVYDFTSLNWCLKIINMPGYHTGIQVKYFCHDVATLNFVSALLTADPSKLV